MVGNKKYKTLAEGIKEMEAEQAKNKDLVAQYAEYVSDLYKSTMPKRPSNNNDINSR